MTAPISFTVGANSYQASKVPPFDQLAIARRLMPVMKNVLTPEVLLNVMQARGEGQVLDIAKIDFKTFIPAMADAFYSLSDDDAERIVRTSLKVVQRQDKGVWASVLAPNGMSMFEDIDLAVMLQIAWKVIEANLGSFFSTPR